MPGMGPVLPALLGRIGAVRTAWRWWAGLGIKDQPQFGKTGVWKEPPEEDSMDGANPAPFCRRLPWGVGAASRASRKHRPAGDNKLIGVCVVAQSLFPSMSPTPRREPGDVNCLRRLSEVFCWEDVFA